MREQLELVPGVKGDQVTWLPGRAEQLTEPGEGKDPFGELLAQHRVVEASLVFHGKQRVPAGHSLREHAPTPVVGWLAVRAETGGCRECRSSAT